MMHSHTRRIETWLRTADILLLVAWLIAAKWFPGNLQTALAWVMGIAWFVGIYTVGGQNATYLHPRHRILYSMALSLGIAAVVGIYWSGTGREWYLKGGIHFLVALGIAGVAIRLAIAHFLQRPAMQLVPCRLPAEYLPLLAELAAHAHIFVEPVLDDPAGALPERRAGYPIYLAVTDMRLRQGEIDALMPLYDQIEVVDLADLYESLLGKVAVVQVDSEWRLPQALRVPSPMREVVARLFDVTFILLTAPLTLLVIGLAALAVRLSSRGPVFFCQQRLGQYGKPYMMVKLRTMRTDAERHGQRWAGHDDERVTKVGRLLRATGLDELPQLWNILRGDMSLVGPRPETAAIAAELEKQIPFYNARLLVLPGIAGWAQLHQGGDSTLDDVSNKIRYDLYYLKYGSLVMNLRILLGTVQMLLHLAKPAPKAKPRPPAPVEL